MISIDYEENLRMFKNRNGLGLDKPIKTITDANELRHWLNILKKYNKKNEGNYVITAWVGKWQGPCYDKPLKIYDHEIIKEEELNKYIESAGKNLLRWDPHLSAGCWEEEDIKYRIDILKNKIKEENVADKFLDLLKNTKTLEGFRKAVAKAYFSE